MRRFETADAEPDAVLADFLRLLVNFTASAPYTPWSQLWFRNVARGDLFVDVPLVCNDTSAPALPLYSYWGQTAAQQPLITCPPYLQDASLYGGGRSLAGCPVLSCIPQGAFSASTDYFPVKAASHGPEWAVSYFPSYKFVVNNLTGGAETYLLYQCGSPIPVPASTLGFNASTMVALDASLLPLYSAATKLFSVPARRVAIDDSLGSVGVTYLELLGVRGAIAYADTAYTVASPCTDYLSALQVIEPLVYPAGSYYPTIPADADLVLEGNSASQYPQGVSVAATSAVDDLVGYASWIQLVGLFFNKEASASLLFNQTAGNIRQLTAAAAQVNGTKRLVAWVSYYGGVWTVEDTSYRRALTADAGGLYLPGATFTSAAAFKAALASVDALIDESYLTDFAPNATLVLLNLGFNASDMASSAYRFIANSDLWRVDGRQGATGSDDWCPTPLHSPPLTLLPRLP